MYGRTNGNATRRVEVEVRGDDPDLASYLRIEERVPERGTRRAPKSHDGLGTQSSRGTPPSGRFLAATLLLMGSLDGENVWLRDGGPNWYASNPAECAGARTVGPNYVAAMPR